MSKYIRFWPKYSDFKFNYKSLKQTLPYHIQNCLNRKSQSNPEQVVSLWEAYREKLHDLDCIRMKKNKHAET